MTEDSQSREDGSVPPSRQTSHTYQLRPHERVCLGFHRLAADDCRRVEARAAELLATVDDPGEDDRCAAFYAAAREIDAPLWVAETRWHPAALDRWFRQGLRHLGELSRKRREVFDAYGLVKGVSMARAQPPRADRVVGAVYFTTEVAVRQDLSRTWLPVKKRGSAVAEGLERGAGATDTYDLSQAQRFFLPEITAQAWAVTDDLLDHWIGEDSADRALAAYQVWRERHNRLRAAELTSKAAPEDLVLFAQAQELEALTARAWSRLQRVRAEHEAFFSAAYTFQVLVASQRGAAEVG